MDKSINEKTNPPSRRRDLAISMETCALALIAFIILLYHSGWLSRITVKRIASITKKDRGMSILNLVFKGGHRNLLFSAETAGKLTVYQ